MTAGSPGRSGEHWIAEEQAALRRVAVLVARAAPPEEVFAAVAAEAGRVLAADVTGISRYDPDGTAAAVGGWDNTGDAMPFAVGTRVRLGGRNVVSLVFETGGADFGRGSGLLGLKDRVEALGGWISLQSAAGASSHADRPAPRRPPQTEVADRRLTG